LTIVMAFDQHREQITWDALDGVTGEVSRGRIRPAERGTFRHFLSRFDGREIEAALEATTGWRFMVEELQAAGAFGASGRAGGDACAAGTEAAGEDRPRRCPPPARAAPAGPGAGVVDPARTYPRAALAGAAAQDAGRAADGLAAAHPRAVPPWAPLEAQPADARAARVARGARAATRGADPGRRRPGDDRSHQTCSWRRWSASCARSRAVGPAPGRFGPTTGSGS
jgi:hypothetical protein